MQAAIESDLIVASGPGRGAAAAIPMDPLEPASAEEAAVTHGDAPAAAALVSGPDPTKPSVRDGWEDIASGPAVLDLGSSEP